MPFGYGDHKNKALVYDSDYLQTRNWNQRGLGLRLAL